MPGWEDSTLGNIYAARNITGEHQECSHGAIRHRVHDRAGRLVPGRVQRFSIGFFQIGGGIAGDFPICVVPMLNQDVEDADVPEWGYFCQISDSTTSFGSYSGAVPNEKITWGKLRVEHAAITSSNPTPRSSRRSFLRRFSAGSSAPLSLFPVFADLTPAPQPAKNRSHENSLSIRNRFSGDARCSPRPFRPRQNSHARHWPRPRVRPRPRPTCNK